MNIWPWSKFREKDRAIQELVVETEWCWIKIAKLTDQLWEHEKPEDAWLLNGSNPHRMQSNYRRLQADKR